MNTTQRNAWLKASGFDGILWKLRTRRFHAWVRMSSLETNLTSSGVVHLAEAVTLRDQLRAMVSWYQP